MGPPPNFMPTEQYPEIKAAAAYSEALNRHIPLLTAFERFLRVCDELIQRCEREMYASLQYGGNPPPEGTKGPTKGFHDPKLASSVVALGRALSQAGAVHARLLADENARADKMSDEDKLKFMLQAVKAKPPAVRRAFAEALLADL